jgi:hypothetical protein
MWGRRRLIVDALKDAHGLGRAVQALGRQAWGLKHEANDLTRAASAESESTTACERQTEAVGGQAMSYGRGARE